MTHPTASTPEEVKKSIDLVHVGPEYFTREDGTPMAVVHADFMKRLLAVYEEHNVVDIDYDDPIFQLPSQEYKSDDTSD